MTSSTSSSMTSTVFGALWTALAGYGVYIIGQVAYRIRLRAIDDFGLVIHEFDPYFNYRATEVRTVLVQVFLVAFLVGVAV